MLAASSHASYNALSEAQQHPRAHALLVGLTMYCSDQIAAELCGCTAEMQAEAGRLGAAAMQAVPTMLELVPTGVDKGVGLQQLMKVRAPSKFSYVDL